MSEDNVNKVRPSFPIEIPPSLCRASSAIRKANGQQNLVCIVIIYMNARYTYLASWDIILYACTSLFQLNESEYLN